MEVAPEIEVACDELTALVEADRPREPHLGAHPVERRDDVGGAVDERGWTSGENLNQLSRMVSARTLRPVAR